jgi:hypothetical protein
MKILCFISFQTSRVVVFYVFSGCCSFCWYWWIWWPSLFKHFFHNYMKLTIQSFFMKVNQNFDKCNKAPLNLKLVTFEIHVQVIAEKLFLPVKFGFTYSCIYNYNNILHYLLFLFLARANSFSFSPYYANHMVLQRGSKGASIWGHSTVHGDKVQLYVNAKLDWKK